MRIVAVNTIVRSHATVINITTGAPNLFDRRHQTNVLRTVIHVVFTRRSIPVTGTPGTASTGLFLAIFVLAALGLFFGNKKYPVRDSSLVTVFKRTPFFAHFLLSGVKRNWHEPEAFSI